jgi:hypothetical protein
MCSTTQIGYLHILLSQKKEGDASSSYDTNTNPPLDNIKN